MKTGDELIALLGAKADDPQVLEALRDFAIRWPPELDETDPPEDQDWHCWRPSSANGFEFGFQDEAFLRALEPKQRGKGPLILSSVCFYGDHEGVKPFSGVMPFGISLGDSRDAVRAKLTSLEVSPRVHLRDVWDTPRHRIIVEHDQTTGRLGSVLVKLRQDPWPPLDEDPPPPLPDTATIVAMFGQPWHSPDMRRVFFPLGLDACGPAIAKAHVADLRQTRGLELYYYADPNRSDDNPIKDKGAVFTQAQLYRARYQDARAWGGALPFGLEFDLAYPEIVRRVGRRPDSAQDGPLSGYALWNLPKFTLHVHHDNVENVIFTLSLFMPGAWQSMTDA
jgi:hypothetical protein